LLVSVIKPQMACFDQSNNKGGNDLDKVKWGTIGCGDVTEVKSGPALQTAEGSELVAVMRRNGAKARDYAERHQVPKWYDDADQLIHDPDVNAVYVATPPGTHAQYAIRAAAAGKPVYVEKPMARNYSECIEMIDACEKAGVPLFVAYYRRRLPAFLKVKELVDTGAIGDVRFVTIQLYQAPKPADYDDTALPWRVLPEEAGGGYFFDFASHQLDFLDYLLGPISVSKGIASNQAGYYPAEDVVSASFIFESGALGSGIWCFTVSENDKRDSTEIVGSKGRIAYSNFDPVPVRVESDGHSEEFRMPIPAHVQQPLIQTVVDELLGRGQCPSTGVSAARTSRIMDEIVSEWRTK
jgi:predicted dehydrogenase